MADEDQLTTSPALDSEWDIEAQLDKPLQTIDGFGPCFNELGWDSLSALDNEDKEAIFQELFAPGVGATAFGKRLWKNWILRLPALLQMKRSAGGPQDLKAMRIGSATLLMAGKAWAKHSRRKETSSVQSMPSRMGRKFPRDWR
jgi:hypothetical protein